VEVWRYDLASGLPGEGDHSRFRYPSKVILLVRGGSVAGAWLAFNVNTIGPSVKLHNLEQLTGLTFAQWVEREGYFADPGANADLTTMGPVEVLNAFFDAISQGNKTRAEACLNPDQMLNTLTMNLGGQKRLYNPGFGPNNSLVENIRKAKLLSYKLGDPEAHAAEITEVGDRRRVLVALQLQATWRDDAFNSPGPQIRFTGLEKYYNGWKLGGLGTGP
jgi:hypothetical protein